MREDIGFGGRGQASRTDAANAPVNCLAFVKNRQGLDITDATELTAVIAAARPDGIINGAAYTAVDMAGLDPDLACAVTTSLWESWPGQRTAMERGCFTSPRISC